MSRTIGLLAAVLLPSICGALSFSDVTAASGITYDHNGGTGTGQARKSAGAAPGDFDGDGWVDLYVTKIDGANVLYRNMGNGTFQNVTVAAFGPNHLSTKKSSGCGWADIDNDGDLDLYVLSLYVTGVSVGNGYDLFINNGSGVFTEEAALRGAAVLGSGRNVGNSVCFGDYDLDGYLDFHVTEWRGDIDGQIDAAGNVDPGAPKNRQNNRLFRNRGAVQPGYFEDVTAAAGVETDDVPGGSPDLDSTGYSSRICDIDRDGLPDLLMAGDSGRSRLWWNNGDGTFTDGTVAAGVGTDRNGMGNALGDYDNDGDLDWFVTSIYKSGTGFNGNRLYRYEGGRTFTERQNTAGVLDGRWGWGASFCDFDHDGDLDLIQANGFDPFPDFNNDKTKLFENNGAGVFADVAGNSTGVNDSESGKAVVSFDYDRDGDMDVLIAITEKKAILYRNNNTTGDWLQIRLEGRRSNRQGIGAFVTLHRGGGLPALVREMSGGSNFLSHDEYLVHFGLGTLAGGTIESVVVEWPSGVSQTLTNVAKNGVLKLVEPELVARVEAVGGWYEFTWNGCKGWSYDVETCVNLGAPVWTKVGDTHEAIGPSTTATVPAAGTAGYYRVVARP